MKTSKNMIGAAGEYYVCAELCRQNILALPTPKNNPIFDLLASDPEGKKTVAIQVKTMSLENNQGWRLGVDMENDRNNPNLFIVLVNMQKDGTNDYYIFQHDDFSARVRGSYRNYLETPKKNGDPRKEVNFRWFDFSCFNEADKNRKNNWSILGF